MAKLRAKMFNLRPFLNRQTVDRFQPVIETVIHDLSDEELSEAHQALATLSGMLTMERVQRDELASVAFLQNDNEPVVLTATYSHDAHCNTAHVADENPCPPAKNGGVTIDRTE